MRLAVALALSLLAAIAACCAPASNEIAPARAVELSKLQGWPASAVEIGRVGSSAEVVVYVSSSCAACERRRARVLAAAAFKVADFEARYGLGVPPTRVGVTDLEWFGDYLGNACYGQWEFRDSADVLICVEGEQSELPCLEHELQHRVRRILHRWPNDDPRWTTVWDPAERVTTALLLALREPGE